MKKYYYLPTTRKNISYNDDYSQFQTTSSSYTVLFGETLQEVLDEAAQILFTHETAFKERSDRFEPYTTVEFYNVILGEALPLEKHIRLVLMESDAWVNLQKEHDKKNLEIERLKHIEDRKNALKSAEEVLEKAREHYEKLKIELSIDC